MNIELYNKYGNYFDGHFIVNHDVFHKFIENRCDGNHKIAKRKLRFCYLWLLIPMMGIIFMYLSLEDKGL